jgi:uncharacterized repeat protein (TIGR01451 family)
LAFRTPPFCEVTILTMKSWASWLTCATAALGLWLPSSASNAQTISNIAQVGWTSPSGPIVVRSNRVDIDVRALPPQAAAFYTVSTPSIATTSTRLDGSACVTAPGTAQSAAEIGSSDPIGITNANRFTAGQTVVVGVRSQGDNRDATVRDTIQVTLTAANGDEEKLVLREDDVNSGFFVASIRTRGIPPALVRQDCYLSVAENSVISIAVGRSDQPGMLITGDLSFLVDPFGIVFDSADGSPVEGARVTLINADTGQAAEVYGDDGLSRFPATVLTGSTVTDAGGTQYIFPAGDYRFPLVAPGRYRLVAEPPDPYRWASSVDPAQLTALRRPDNGEPFTINGASYGAVFTLSTPTPVRIDIPVDRPGAGLTLTKQASVAVAVPGDIVRYRVTIRNADTRRASGRITINDALPASMRLRLNSIRYNGRLVAPESVTNGSSFTLNLSNLAGNTSGLITYLAEIRPDAAPGEAVNVVTARDDQGNIAPPADATVRVRRDVIGDRLTIIGRVTDGGCRANPRAARGIRGVRIVLQDGSFAITDSDGQYYFEGVRSGTSVVAMDRSTLPEGQVAIDCARNVETAGSPYSRFVDGRGGELVRADFHAASITSDEVPADAVLATTPRREAPVRPTPATDAAAAGAEADFTAGQTAGIEWLFPALGHNPRSPSIRVAIKHLRGQTVRLTIDGRPVDTLNFEGALPSGDGTFAISNWRGIPLGDRTNLLAADVLNEDGSLAQHLERPVHYSAGPLQATLVSSQSLLVADGISRPVVAIRLTDRDGRPVRNGVVGQFNVAPPHRAAIARDAEQTRQLSGLEQAQTNWRVVGDDGVAYIELEPTTASGTAQINFTFRDGQTARSQVLDLWLDAASRPWTLSGYAAGTIGYNTLDDRFDAVARDLPNDNTDGRVALFASGPLGGSWQATLAYDSDKEQDEARFGGVIDPTAYYTIYGDRSDRGFDAASVRNLYARIERPNFYALFGDYQTAINDPQLTRYQRSMNGLRAEYRRGSIAATLFAADTPYRYRREEMQGNGLSGPYQLAVRDVLANSERVTIEVRDRLRSDLIIDRRTLSRHIDYDIDYFAGTLRFREPVLSRDADLNPQFIIIDFEVNGVGGRVLNAGGRVAWTSTNDALRVGVTAIHDETDSSRTNVAGVDVRYRHNAATEVRAEFAASRSEATGNATAATPGTPQAWLVEVEHHGPSFDVLAYARQRDRGFGTGQLTNAGEGSRRYGVDGTLRLGREFSLLASAWQEEYLASDARRRAARLLGEWRTDTRSLRAGLTHADDILSDGSNNRSTIVQFGGSQRLFNQALELDAQTEFGLGNSDASVDFPARHQLGARWTVAQGIALIGLYEIADGSSVQARTARVGVDVQPLAGSRINLTANRQDLGEFGPRSFAAYGLSQSIPINERLTIDATIDGQRTLSGVRASDVLDPAHPAASGGFLGTGSLITEDFLAITGGATYRADAWSLAGRAEYRDGETVNRYGVTLGGIRTLGEGRAFGGLLTYTHAAQAGGATTETLQSEISWANRPLGSRWSWLEKLEYRLDAVTGAVAGTPGPIGGPALLVTGDVRSQRVINSITINYSPVGQLRDGDQPVRWTERGEYQLFWGARYSSDRIDADDVSGWSSVVGADMRYDVSPQVAVGVSANVRVGTDARAWAYSVGPQVTIAPMDNTNIIIGYNATGYRDRDFEDSRYSRAGFYATVRIKFDQLSLASLGLR